MVQKLLILKLEPDLDPKPEKLCEHGARYPGKCVLLGFTATLYSVTVSSLLLGYKKETVFRIAHTKRAIN